METQFVDDILPVPCRYIDRAISTLYIAQAHCKNQAVLDIQKAIDILDSFVGNDQD